MTARGNWLVSWYHPTEPMLFGQRVGLYPIPGALQIEASSRSFTIRRKKGMKA